MSPHYPIHDRAPSPLNEAIQDAVLALVTDEVERTITTCCVATIFYDGHGVIRGYQALELGMIILHRVPFLLILDEGSRPPRGLLDAAHEVVEADFAGLSESADLIVKAFLCAYDDTAPHQMDREEAKASMAALVEAAAAYEEARAPQNAEDPA